MSPPPALRVLVVDDDRLCRRTTTLQLQQAGFSADSEPDAGGALARLRSERWDIVITDLRMPRMDGLALLREVQRDHPGVDVVVMTAFGSVESAVEAMRAGAADYVSKPFPFAELELRVHRIAQRRQDARHLHVLTAALDVPARDGLIGRSDAMRGVRERLALFAPHAAPVLITGETGTGKEVVARALHAAGPRAHAPFVAVACGAIPHELAESTFLGHEKGAFTGATQRRRGCFEQAHGSTLLLDDVDDLPRELQVKLLRVLQEGLVARVGSAEEFPVDVRVVATSKVDLAGAVAAGRFRADLYYRLRGLELALPPLRERGDDILLLAAHFLRLAAAGQGRPPARLSVAAASTLKAASWPGNVRELRRAMESADVLCGGGEVGAEHLPGAATRTDEGPFVLRLPPGVPVRMPDLVRRFEADLIAWAMASAGGQQTHAAELLGVPRTTLQSKLRADEG